MASHPISLISWSARQLVLSRDALAIAGAEALGILGAGSAADGLAGSIISRVVDLDGQRVTAVNFDAADTTLEFDLGATVRLGKSIFPTDAKSALWSLGRFGTPSLSLLNDGSMVRGDEVVS